MNPRGSSCGSTAPFFLPCLGSPSRPSSSICSYSAPFQLPCRGEGGAQEVVKVGLHPPAVMARPCCRFHLACWGVWLCKTAANSSTVLQEVSITTNKDNPTAYKSIPGPNPLGAVNRVLRGNTVPSAHPVVYFQTTPPQRCLVRPRPSHRNLSHPSHWSHLYHHRLGFGG